MHSIAIILSSLDTTTPIVIALLGSGGFVGAVVAVVRLKPDMNSSAVSQARDALEMMQQLVEDLEKDRTYWRERYERMHKRNADLSAELMDARQMIRHWDEAARRAERPGDAEPHAEP